jgi:trehalose 6-phosphate synthase
MADMERRLVLLSNRGPATFERDDSGRLVPRRGGGGLVTALTGLLRHRDALWIASAMTDEDVEASSGHDSSGFEVEMEGITYKIRLVASDPEAYDAFYNVIANPMLWFIQHYLWDLSNVPDFRLIERDAWNNGYKRVNEDLAGAALEAIEGIDEPLVMVHDYHLYTCPALIRRARPDVFLHHFVHIPWTAPDAWRVLPADVRQEIFEGLLSNDTIGFHTRSYCNNFLQCCRELMDLRTDFKRGAVISPDGHETWVRPYPLAIDREAFAEAASSEGVARHEEEILRRRRRHLILRVDRADLSKNVLRGFTAFDIFLDQHPEFREEVTFIAHLQPSRQDVPEYVEYLEKIEALVAVINHRHGTTDWMPIDLRLRDDFDEAVALYKHFDLLLVNAMWDGMNLVSKEGPLVNTRDGMMILSENTGAHEELGACALSVNPFDVQEQADAMYRALTATPEERERRMRLLQHIIESRTPADWINDQLADIEEKRAAGQRARPV